MEYINCLKIAKLERTKNKKLIKKRHEKAMLLRHKQPD